MKRAGGLLAVRAAILMLWIPLAGCNKSESQSGGSAGGNAIPVEALVLMPQPIENKIQTTGTLLANEEVELRPEISGRVTDVYFEEGGRVKEGELLVKRQPGTTPAHSRAVERVEAASTRPAQPGRPIRQP